MAAPPPPPPAAPSASLDEITNRVFEELLQGKAATSTRPASDQGSVRVRIVNGFQQMLKGKGQQFVF